MKGRFLALAAVGTMAFAFATSSTPASAHHVELLGNTLPHMTAKSEKLILHADYNCTDQEYEGSNRNVIQLQADFGVIGSSHESLVGNVTKENDIFLVDASTFGVDNFTVLDGNACDNASADGATFALPSDIDENWAVYIKLVGQPGKKIDIAACVLDGGVVLCGESVIRVRGSGKPTGSNVTNQLLKPIDLSKVS